MLEFSVSETGFHMQKKSFPTDLAEHVNPKRVRWSDAKPKKSFELYKYCIV